MRGLKLFIADIIDDDTGEQTFWYQVVEVKGENEDE